MTNTRTHARMSDLLSRPTLELNSGGAPKHVLYFPYHEAVGHMHIHTLHFPAQGKTDGNMGISQKTALRRHVVAGNISPETGAERGKWDLTTADDPHTHSFACSLLCGGVNKLSCC